MSHPSSTERAQVAGTGGLPQEVRVESDVRTVGRVVALAALFFTVLNLALAALHSMLPINGDLWVAGAKWALLAESHSAEVVYVGDSTCAVGLDPGAVQAELGLRGVNLCTVGNMGLLDDVVMIDELTRSGGGPRLFVVVHSLDVWARPLDDRAAARLPWRKLPSAYRQVGVPASVTGWGRVLLTKSVPLYAHRDALRALARRPRAVLGRLPVRLADDGWRGVDTPNPGVLAADLTDWRAALGGRSFEVSPSTDRALRFLEALAEERGLTVLIANGPLAETMARDPQIRPYMMSRDEAFRRRFRGPEVEYVEWQGVYPDTIMESADHVVGGGAQEYSAALGRELRRALGPNRARPGGR